MSTSDRRVEWSRGLNCLLGGARSTVQHWGGGSRLGRLYCCAAAKDAAELRLGKEGMCGVARFLSGGKWLGDGGNCQLTCGVGEKPVRGQGSSNGSNGAWTENTRTAGRREGQVMVCLSLPPVAKYRVKIQRCCGCMAVCEEAMGEGSFAV